MKVADRELSLLAGREPNLRSWILVDRIGEIDEHRTVNRAVRGVQVNAVVATPHETGQQIRRIATPRVHAWSLPSAEALWWVAASWALGTTAMAVVGIWTGTP